MESEKWIVASLVTKVAKGFGRGAENSLRRRHFSCLILSVYLDLDSRNAYFVTRSILPLLAKAKIATK